MLFSQYDVMACSDTCTDTYCERIMCLKNSEWLIEKKRKFSFYDLVISPLKVPILAVLPEEKQKTVQIKTTQKDTEKDEQKPACYSTNLEHAPLCFFPLLGEQALCELPNTSHSSTSLPSSDTMQKRSKALPL